MVCVREVSPDLSRAVCDGCAGRDAEPTAAVCGAVDAQDAGGVFDGVDGAYQAESAGAARLRPVQRVVHDARDDVAVLSADCVAGCGGGDDGRAGGADADERDDSGCDQLPEGDVVGGAPAAGGGGWRGMVLPAVSAGPRDQFRGAQAAV